MSDSELIFQRPVRGSRGPTPSHTRDEIVAAAAVVIAEPVDCPVARKFEAIAMLTGVVTLFAQPQPAEVSFAGIDMARYPHLMAALTGASAAGAAGGAPSPDLFERTVRSLLAGLLSGKEPPEAETVAEAG